MSARLALIGAPGAGKSTVAAALAARWGCQMVDTDAEFGRQHAISVAEAIIDDEAAFRVAEEEITVAALATDGAVVAVGSGAVNAQSVQQVLRRMPTVWLRVGLVEAAKRSGLTGARPVALGNVRGQLHGMLEERAPLYESLADLVVATDGRLADEVADEIADWEEQG